MTRRASVLDLGSNSFHVLVADVEPDGIVVPVLREREMLHLGAVVERNDGRIPDAERERAVDVVRHLTDLARRAGTTHHVGVATSALRDASNGPEVVAALSAAAEADVRVLDGLDEAALSYLGVRAGIAVTDEPVLTLDLGGGSLELAVGRGSEVTWAASTDLGVSRLSASVDADPPTEAEVGRLRDRIRAEVGPLVDTVRAHAPALVVAVGGTVRALARVVAAEAGEWLPATLNQYAITTATLDRWSDDLLALDLDARLGLPGMKSRRADRIHLAALVVSETLDVLGVERVLVSDWGLREGVLLDALDVHEVPGGDELRTRAVARLRDAFAGSDPHLAHVAHLAGEVFDATADVHGLPAGDRDLLVHGANLHDVGESLALRGHHRHGAYIVENAEMRGFSPAETAILASLVRFHRSAGTSTDFPPYAALSRANRERCDRMLALLQIADGLDRARDQAVRGVTSRRDGDRLVLEVSGDGLHAAIAEVDRKLALFERTFGVDLTVEDPGPP